MHKLPSALIYFAAVLSSAAAAPHAAEADISVIEFPSATTPPSKLKIRQAKAKGIELKAELGIPIRGQLGMPEGDGPFPAIVMMSGCQGVKPFQDSWARQFNEWGYATLQVDTFGSRNLHNVCAESWGGGETGDEVLDAFGALFYLESHPNVQAGKIAAVGWARGSTLSLAFRDSMRQLFDHGFNAVVAFYPDCRQITTPAFKEPVLILTPGKDDWTQTEICKRLASEDDHVELIEFPEALRGFDDPAMGEKTEMADFHNTYKSPALGVTFGYDAATHQAASATVREYLAEHVK